MQVSWPCLWEMRFSELRNMQREEKKEKEIKGKQAINNRKPVFKLYIIHYSATRSLSPDIRYCSIWHVSKAGRGRTRGS